ncbi:coiled-coil domain-containing protein 15 [Periophthalmus magnuspinnatus]|uniref:coiled-coil domain-containing protein 15 n=1 Tax=Periophthalmus magnuspinnatus TaxID=409849 RepID=UPI002436AC21|nr:coiled-coil domain-containing protein 15 [Periophthalmus magnuspinnatus]XP_055082301.1 coiled-coil domain-containing protein 15 [Periophthalmus magnuspinnatus]
MTSTNRKTTVPGRVALGSRILAHRNQAAVAVGAWVESGAELWKHPAAQASLTEELQEERRKRSEQNLLVFQENVRVRVAQQERLRRRERAGAQPQVRSASKADESSPSDGDTQGTAQCGAWSVRRRLACPLEPQEPPVSAHEEATHMGNGDEVPCRHGTLTQHKESGPEQSPDRPLCNRRGMVLWPIDHTEELRRERQTHILMQRRLFLSKDRQNVKENQEHKKHLRKTASLKGQKEQVRLDEERKLVEAQLLSRAQESLEQREQQIQHTLRQEAAAETGEGRRRHPHIPKTTRQINALRAQLRQLFPEPGHDLPPLCCCGSFWESHPDTCANNCVFHNNPKAYVQALQTVVHCWDLL